MAGADRQRKDPLLDQLLGSKDDEEANIGGTHPSEGGTRASSSEAVSERSHDDGHDGHGHGPAHAPPTAVSLVSSAVVCFLIYFVFCVVFSTVVWDPISGATSLDEGIDPPFGIPQGVNTNLVGIAVGSVFFAWGSGCKGIMAGPDLLPLIFFGSAANIVVAALASKSGKRPCDGHHPHDGHHPFLSEDGDYRSSLRLLGYGAHGEGTDPCTDVHHRSLGGKSELYIEPGLVERIVPTILLAMMIGNLITGIVFYVLGQMKKTASFIGAIPASVVAGFLTCIGYKVIKLAILITTGITFKQKYFKEFTNNEFDTPDLSLAIAVVYGVALYALKRLHIVPTEWLILAFIAVPLVIFFSVVAAMGISMQELRDADWFLTQSRDGQGCTDNCAFNFIPLWQTIEVPYKGLAEGLVEWIAILECIPIFVMGSAMTALDSVLKLPSIEGTLSADLDYNHEMRLGGGATAISSLLVGSPAYGQAKFDAINLSIGRTAESPVPTIILGVLCVITVLSGVSGFVIDIMPRFLLGGLCVFGGVGFLWEYLWEARTQMNKFSFAIVWMIFLVNFIWEVFLLQNLDPKIQPMVPGLLIVFVLGILLSVLEFFFSFIHISKPPTMKEGHNYCSSAIRSEKSEKQLAVVASWFHVFHAESFLFFGTANSVFQRLKSHIEGQKSGPEAKPKSERTKILIFDLVEVMGVDNSAKAVLFKVQRLLKKEGIKLAWAMDSPSLVGKFSDWGLFKGTMGHESTPGYFISLDLALCHVENTLLGYATRLSERWLKEDTVRNIFEWHVLSNVFNISVRSEEAFISSTRLAPWSERITFREGTELCGPEDDNLYLLYFGEVEILKCDSSTSPVFTGSFFNVDRLLISVGALKGEPSTVGATVKEESMVLVVSRRNFVAMQSADPALAQKLLMTLVVQSERKFPGRRRVRPKRNRPTDLSGNSMTVARLLTNNDCEISLTEAQKEKFSRVFDIILSDYGQGDNNVSADDFSKYVNAEAHALGSQLDPGRFAKMVNDSGIDSDNDGMLTKDEFLTFLRGLFVAGVPSSELSRLREAYDAAVAEDPDTPMNESRLQILFTKLGFDVANAGWDVVVGVIDADGDGNVSFHEFMTGIGLMKRFRMMSDELGRAFKDYKTKAKMKMERHSFYQSEGGETVHRSRESVETAIKNVNELTSLDLHAFLDVSREEAEEMIFLSDKDDAENDVKAKRTIDKEEFQQLISEWS